jgi:putative ATP-dependent endonuclease of OLD family
VRISRLRLHNFRGWADLDLRPAGHVLLAGVPRAGRSDIILALMRLLYPASIRLQPALADIRQQRSAPAPADKVSPTEGAGNGEAGIDSEEDIASEPADAELVAPAEYAEVEVTLVELDAELEQLCEGFLEPLDADGQVDESGNAAPNAALGVRLAYRLSYDPNADSLTPVVFFPARSNPTTEQYARVPAAVRRALPVVVLDTARPLQLRAEGVLRRLVTDRNADGAAAAFHALEQAVAAATDALSADPTIAGTVDAVLQAGGLAGHLADASATAADVRFRPDDGSLAALLRAVQPALELDDAGLLTLSSHGSTAATVLAAAEALLLAASVDGAVVLGDDFGDALDAATAEHLAAVLRARADQVWLTTRRPEAARAFAPGELVRLSRGATGRAHHLVPEPTDKKEVALRRLLHAQLLPALTAPVVAITEGIHDLTAYSAADRHRSATALPLSAAGVRLICADNGSGGGTGQIPRVATLARALGFRVIAVIDGDPKKRSGSVLADIEAACDAVVRLPDSAAIEVALTAGVEVTALRAAAAVLLVYGVTDPTVGKADDDVSDAVVKLLHDKGLHEQFLDALVDVLGSVPPLLDSVLNAVATAAGLASNGPMTIEVVAPAPAPPRAARTQ